MGNNLSNTIIDALPENDRPFQLTGTSAMGRYTVIFGIAGISLYDHNANKHYGPIRWE